MATRTVKMSDGILLPRYRLPTEAEWEFAAYGLIGTLTKELSKRLYPWDGHCKKSTGKFPGDMLANFVGKGSDYGCSGSLE